MKFLIVSALCLVWHFPLTTTQSERTTQEKVAAQSPDPPRVTVKGGKMKNTLVYKKTPNYPAEARQQRIAGTVTLHVVVGVDGGVKQVDLISGPPILAQPSIDAVRQWRYKPPKENGQPVEVDTTVEVVFSFVQ